MGVRGVSPRHDPHLNRGLLYKGKGESPRHTPLHLTGALVYIWSLHIDDGPPSQRISPAPPCTDDHYTYRRHDTARPLFQLSTDPLPRVLLYLSPTAQHRTSASAQLSSSDIAHTRTPRVAECRIPQSPPPRPSVWCSRSAVPCGRMGVGGWVEMRKKDILLWTTNYSCCVLFTLRSVTGDGGGNWEDISWWITK